MASKDYTYHNLKELIKNDDVVIVSGDKNSCVLVMDKTDYVTKLEEMINEGISKGVYTPTP